MKPRKLRNKRKTDFSFAKYFNIDKSPHTSFNPITHVLEYMAKHETRRIGKVVYDSWRKDKNGVKIPYVRKTHGALANPKNN